MKRILTIALALFCATSFGATLNPIQLLNPAGSASGQAIVSTGPSTAPTWGNVSISTLTGVLPIANGGTGSATASGARTNLGLGSSATVNVGTSGAAIPLLNTANTWALAQTFSIRPTFNGNTPYDTGNLTIANYLTTASAASTYAQKGANTDITSLNAPALGAATATTAANANSSTLVATTAFVQTQSINTGTMSSVGASRAIGTTYTNSGARPRFVYATINPGAAATVTITINGVAITGPGSTAAGISLFTAFIVPPGGTYAVTVSGTGNGLYSWVELQ